MRKNEFKGKSIIIAIPDHFGLPLRFKENLNALGFNVYIIPDNVNTKIGFVNTIIHGYRKFFLGKKNYKNIKKAEIKLYQQLSVFNKKNIEKFDYALFIRPDLFDVQLINAVRKRTNKMSAYQWDGLDRFPLVYERIDLFDRFFIFDINDLGKNSKLLPLTNFYFDDITSNSKNEYDVYFVGTYMKNRISLLKKLAQKFKNLNIKSSINLHVISKAKAKKINSEAINIINKPISFKDNITNVLKSKVILDFANDVHYGISMRTFEAIGYKKKLITNNPLVKRYDFYNPQNIFVIENENLDGIEDFLLTPYKEVDGNLLEKYSFTNWLKYVLDIHPNYPIDLK